MGAYWKGDYSSGGLNIFVVVGQIPVEIFLLINYFFDGTPTSNRMSFFYIFS